MGSSSQVHEDSSEADSYNIIHFDGKLTCKELSTLLSQIEVYLNSRPLVPLPNDDDGIKALTPGHFMTGKLLRTLPDAAPAESISLYSNVDSYLCKALLRCFWKC